MKKYGFLILVLISFCSVAFGNVFLKPNDAFKVNFYPVEEGLIFDMDIAKDIHLYYDKLKIKIVNLNNTDITKELELPKKDKFKGMDVINDDFKILITKNLLKTKSEMNSFELEFSYQGCYKTSICYAPIRKRLIYKTNWSKK